MASTLLTPSGLLLKGSPKVLPSPTMAVHRLPVLMIKMKKGGIECRLEIIISWTVAAMVTPAVAAASPAVALVDERLSTEGTGLPFGLSNNLLGWILAGVFGLIWALYFVYTSSLEEDEDSGLSL